MKKLEVKIFSIKRDGTKMEHTEIVDYKSSLDKDNNLESFSFIFRPLCDVCEVRAKMVEVE